MRVKNESRWIARAVQSILPVCSRVYVFDDSSVDTTAKEARDAGAEVILSRLKGTDEVRDKNLLLDLIGSRVPDTDWIIMIDGDEVLQHAERLEDTIRQTPMDCVSLPVLYLWDREDQVRIDGVYGNFRRESAFRLTAERFRATTHGGNFHCGNVPAGLRSRCAYVKAAIAALRLPESRGPNPQIRVVRQARPEQQNRRWLSAHGGRRRVPRRFKVYARWPAGVALAVRFGNPRRHRLTHGGHKVNFRPPDELAPESIHLQPMSDLDLMIANGWGDVPQYRIPYDWRTRPNPKPKPPQKKV